MPEHDGHRYYCTKETCPVSASIYGYYPSLGWNAFPLAIAAIACIAQLGLGIKYKTWSYMVAMTIGCFLEAIGMQCHSFTPKLAQAGMGLGWV